MATGAKTDVKLSERDQDQGEDFQITKDEDSELHQRRDFEDFLRKLLTQEDIRLIRAKISPETLTQCETNSLFMSMLVNYELRRLADRKLPNMDDVTKLAISVEEFTNRLIDPLKSDVTVRSQFQECFDEVLETAIELQQKKFCVNPLINNMMNDRWYGYLGRMWTWSYFTVGRWKWIFLDFWCLFDVVLFPFVFAVLFLVHVARLWSRGDEGARKKDLYERYWDYFTTPYFMFIRDQLSYLALLGLHIAVCLSPNVSGGVEWAIVVFFIGRAVMVIKQFITINQHLERKKQGQLSKMQRLKDSLTTYTRNRWNLLDLVNLFVYACILCFTITTSSGLFQLLGGYLYGLNTMILTFRVFGQVMETVKGLGTIQIALFSILSDVATIFWQFAATILAFSVAITKIYMSGPSPTSGPQNGVCSHSGSYCWWSLVKHLLWSLLGMVDKDPLESVDELTESLAKVFYAAYLVLAAILLMNMMIALLSNTYQRVEDNSMKEWLYKKCITVQTYTYLHPVPVPLNLISTLFMVFRWLGQRCKLPFRQRCLRGRRRHIHKPPCLGHTKLDDVVEKLQNVYFATYGCSFPLAETEKINEMRAEMKGNRQILQRASKTHPDLPMDQKVIPGDQADGGAEYTDFGDEEVALKDMSRKLPAFSDTATNNSRDTILCELEEDLSRFRRLRNTILDKLRNFEDLFDDRHRELMNLAHAGGEQESQRILCSVDEKEIACSDILKTLKKDLEDLHKMAGTKPRVVLNAHAEENKDNVKKNFHRFKRGSQSIPYNSRRNQVALFPGETKSLFVTAV